MQCTPHGGFGEDFWVFEIKDTTTGVFNNKVDNNVVKVYPNPAGDYVLFEISPATIKNGVINNNRVISNRGAGQGAGVRNPPANTQPANKTLAFKDDRNNQGVSQSLRSFDMTVVVVNIFGQEVARLPVKGEKTVWDCRDVQNGIYFYSVEIEGKVVSGKVVVRK
ncbi:MAG: hypothetical protein B6D61_10750 [Bacteroidetes bacterium 4484_249]|nr:MAG: hypothetical protein B6D61_10750 [Bacteroidetes bacterium 4484_249]